MCQVDILTKKYLVLQHLSIDCNSYNTCCTYHSYIIHALQCQRSSNPYRLVKFLRDSTSSSIMARSMTSGSRISTSSSCLTLQQTRDNRHAIDQTNLHHQTSHPVLPLPPQRSPLHVATSNLTYDAFYRIVKRRSRPCWLSVMVAKEAIET